ncbi:MAG: hypothetical protein ACOYOT_14035, partial [Bacteroidales bacterium]
SKIACFLIKSLILTKLHYMSYFSVAHFTSATYLNIVQLGEVYFFNFNAFGGNITALGTKYTPCSP